MNECLCNVFGKDWEGPGPSKHPTDTLPEAALGRGQPGRQPPAGGASCSLSSSSRGSSGVIALGWVRPRWMAAGPGVPGSSGPSQPIAPGLHQALLVLITSPSPDRLPPRWVLDFSILRGLLGPDHQIKLCPDVLDAQRSDSPCPVPRGWGCSRCTDTLSHQHTRPQAHKRTPSSTPRSRGYAASTTDTQTPTLGAPQRSRETQPSCRLEASRILRDDKSPQPAPRICCCSQCLH